VEALKNFYITWFMKFAGCWK